MGQLGSFLKLVAAAFCGAAILYIVISHNSVNLPDATSSVPLAEMNISYTDFLTLLLTCVTVVLAAVGIAIGVVAAYTVSSLKDDAKSEVNNAVTERMKKVDEKLDRVEANLQAKVTAIAYGVGQSLDDEDADPDMEER
ncbi:hypothetical protein E2K80_05640 [Rhodophyticola sp. CCM32]|uniref:hypothetical protein n=1 Tax=Rhodophyticola sp. CCM32 TaxID=2916397 RepID=UPI00107FA02E|nr:hypothetical protein [Rhodophyticola sp. CCM32]QBY00282.1 hypothetical protein E2K80_05640 [Rhodophyticola sp. CCM32]